LAATLRRESFDLCLDFQSLPWTALLARGTGAWSIGFAKRYRAPVYRRAIPLGNHRGSDFAAEHKLDLVRAAGVDAQLTFPRLVPPPADPAPWGEAGGRPRVALVPVSLVPKKRWSLDAFAETARQLHRATGAYVLLAGGPGEREPLEAVAAEMEAVPHGIRVCTRLATFGALLQGADLYLGNDNGPRHIALALGTPTLAYFGSQNPTHWTPPATDRHPVIWDLNRARGRPVRSDLRIVADTPAAVAAEAAALLARTAAGPRA